MTNFIIYMVGVVIVVAGLAYGLSVAGLSPVWIGVAAAVLIGLGIMGAIVKTRQKEPSA
jgi:hypothetical protein